jgi:hypothetical protein
LNRFKIKPKYRFKYRFVSRFLKPKFGRLYIVRLFTVLVKGYVLGADKKKGYVLGADKVTV